MAHSELNSRRPISPHLSVWRPTITYVMSIVHRITGVGLVLGMLLLAWWLIAAASGPEAFATADAFFGSWFGMLILFGFTWALFHHALGGVRHMIWDMGAGYSTQARYGLAWGTLIGSVVLTLVVWGLALMLR